VRGGDQMNLYLYLPVPNSPFLSILERILSNRGFQIYVFYFYFTIVSILIDVYNAMYDVVGDGTRQLYFKNKLRQIETRTEKRFSLLNFMLNLIL